MKIFTSRLIAAVVLATPLALAQNAPYTNGVISLNPLGYWKFDGNFNDASTHNNPGMDGNAANPITYTVVGGGAPIDLGGQAAIFNSSKAQYVNVPAGSAFSFGALQPFTLMAWVRTANQGLSTMAILGKIDATQTGYALVINNSLPSAPAGGGRFALRLQSQNSVSEIESTVPVNDGAWHFLAVTNNGSSFLTGIQFYLDGAQIATNIDQNGLTGSILNNSVFTIGGLPASGSLSPFEGLIDEVAVFNTALTQTQIQQLAGFAAGARKILPQFVFGGGWYSAIYFTNTGGSTVSFPVNFTADNGTPLSVPLIGIATAVTLAPGTSTVIEAPNLGFLSQGYASFTPPPGVFGYGVFRQSLQGKPDQEAVVPFSAASTTTSTLLWDETGNLSTGIAIANPNAIAVTVNISVNKSDGSVIGTAVVPVGPNAHTAGLWSQPPFNITGTAGNRGTAVFSVTSGNVTVLGLRADGIALTSIPTADK
jgi:Concanavalin A-like lectin/glucanases superfamily